MVVNLEPQKILLIRNDNIGDLICSIPAIQRIRKGFPHARMVLLVNSYNAPVVAPLQPKDIDQFLIYQKTKHVGLGFRQMGHLFRFYTQLLREGYDTVVLLVGGSSRQAQSFAKWSGARRTVGYGEDNEGPDFVQGLHEVEYSWRLATYLCGTQENPPPQINYPLQAQGVRTAIQITSRKPGNRWSKDKFVELAHRLYERTGQRSILLWSPGDVQTATHPGDDVKAADILERASNVLEPHPTGTLPDLISALQECRYLVTPDGGAMHLAAAMGISLVALFGQSEPRRWRPWTPRAEVLQSPSQTIDDLSVEEVAQAYRRLTGR